MEVEDEACGTEMDEVGLESDERSPRGMLSELTDLCSSIGPVCDILLRRGRSWTGTRVLQPLGALPPAGSPVVKATMARAHLMRRGGGGGPKGVGQKTMKAEEANVGGNGRALTLAWPLRSADQGLVLADDEEGSSNPAWVENYWWTRMRGRVKRGGGDSWEQSSGWDERKLTVHPGECMLR